jgi:hypothetical protein
MFRFSTLTLLNSSDHDSPSCGLEPTLLICEVINVTSVLYYLAKTARANPALSIANAQSSLREHQHKPLPKGKQVKRRF